ncbi:MAG: hypothetical protein MZV63_40265, partial [Marinilabiliales bacterium]|nr:hypothetical protein [Marinilabiliales bacterium]
KRRGSSPAFDIRPPYWTRHRRLIDEPRREMSDTLMNEERACPRRVGSSPRPGSASTWPWASSTPGACSASS